MLQRQNNLVLLLIVFIFIIVVPLSLEASIYEYNPDIDISLGDYYLLMHDNGNITISGSYIGILYIMESPLFFNLFSATKFYSIYNIGTVFLNDGDNNTVVFIPFFIDLSYRFQLFKRFELMPFLGWGFGIIPTDYAQVKRSALFSINGGILIRYRLWDTAYLKLRIEYGTIFGNQFQDRGYANFVKIVYPIPFIP